MGIALLVVLVGHHDLRTHTPDHGHEPAHRLVEGCLGEAVGAGVGRRVLHARVAVAEHDHLVVADHRGGGLELTASDTGEVGAHLGRVHGRVEDVALLASGAAHEDGVDALGVVARHGGRPLRRLVVGVGVDGQQTQARAHRPHGTRPVWRPEQCQSGPP